MNSAAPLEVNEMIQTAPAHMEITGLVRMGVYANQDEVIADGIRNLLLNNQPLRLELALELFKNDEVSLGRAAEIAGIDRWSFEDVMRERGIKQVIECDSAEEMDKQLDFFFGRSK